VAEQGGQRTAEGTNKSLVPPLPGLFTHGPITSSRDDRELNQSVAPNLSTLSYVISQTGTETATVELNRTTETMDIEFCPQQIQPLVDLCTKIQLWYD